MFLQIAIIAMTKFEFEALSLTEKSALLWQYGELISNSAGDLHIISLYRLYAFFVEFQCDSHFTKIEEIRVKAAEQLVA